MKTTKSLKFAGLCLFITLLPVNANKDPEKPRVIVLTDIENEPDDARSLVRFLTYATIWRWRKTFQHDFAARMDWCVQPFEDANHPPLPALGHPDILEVVEDSMVPLIAEGCTDPDGDGLSYNWTYYREVGNSVYWLKIENEDSAEASFKAPVLGYPQTMHFILSVTDDGEPSLTRYKRVIVKVNPEVAIPLLTRSR